MVLWNFVASVIDTGEGLLSWIEAKKLLSVSIESAHGVSLTLLFCFILEYNVPVEVIPFLPLTREHVRQCVAAELR